MIALEYILPELFLLQREEGRRALTTGRTDKRVEK
jgi:hypothetical protein